MNRDYVEALAADYDESGRGNAYLGFIAGFKAALDYVAAQKVQVPFKYTDAIFEMKAISELLPDLNQMGDHET